MTQTKNIGRPIIVSPQLIIDTALEILDEEGIDFSVRKLAKQLNTGPSTIYNHFSNRDGLLDVAVALSGSDQLALFFGNLPPVLTTLPVMLAAGSVPSDVGIADLNRDGIRSLFNFFKFFQANAIVCAITTE